jgi:Zn-dependent protease
MNPEILLIFPVLLFSLSLHEFAHSWTAKKGGDMTGTLEGRSTLNPISHIDPFGTLILPAVLYIMGAPIFAWAKPVPVTETQLRHSRWLIWVSMAGPASNILIALVAAAVMKIALLAGGDAADVAFHLGLSQKMQGIGVGAILFRVGIYFLQLNLMLAIFNMIPIPPLDGSKLVYYFFIRRNLNLYPFWISLNQFGFIAIYFLFMLIPVRRALSTAIEVPLIITLSWLGI